MHWEPLAMALLLLVLAGLAGWALFQPTTGPSRRGGKRSFTDEFLWKHAPSLYTAGEKSLILLGLVALLAGAAFCVKSAFTP